MGNHPNSTRSAAAKSAHDHTRQQFRAGPYVAFMLHGAAASREQSFSARHVPTAATIFATQLGSMRKYELVQRRNEERILGPKTLIKWHAIELAGMAAAEFQRCAGLPHRAGHGQALENQG